MKAQFGEVNAESISAADIDTLQSFGMTFRKAEYIKDFAEKVKTGEFALQEISQLHRRMDSGNDFAVLLAAA